LFATFFILIEVYIAVEPVFPISLLKEKVPVLVGFSNALVAVTNLSVTYYFPTWFQTVMLSSASTAGMLQPLIGQGHLTMHLEDSIYYPIVSVSLVAHFSRGEFSYLIVPFSTYNGKMDDETVWEIQNLKHDIWHSPFFCRRSYVADEGNIERRTPVA
jgi:hypothetical protein